MFEFFTIVWLLLVCLASIVLAVFGITRTETAKLIFFPKTARSAQAGRRSIASMVGIFTTMGTGLIVVLLYLCV